MQPGSSTRRTSTILTSLGLMFPLPALLLLQLKPFIATDAIKPAA